MLKFTLNWESSTKVSQDLLTHKSFELLVEGCVKLVHLSRHLSDLLCDFLKLFIRNRWSVRLIPANWTSKVGTGEPKSVIRLYRVLLAEIKACATLILHPGVCAKIEVAIPLVALEGTTSAQVVPWLVEQPIIWHACWAHSKGVGRLERALVVGPLIVRVEVVSKIVEAKSTHL